MRSSRYHQLHFVSRAFIGGIPRLDKADTVIYMARQFYVKWHPLGPFTFIGAIAARSAALRYLPQYSPDLNPIDAKLAAFCVVRKSP